MPTFQLLQTNVRGGSDYCAWRKRGMTRTLVFFPRFSSTNFAPTVVARNGTALSNDLSNQIPGNMPNSLDKTHTPLSLS